MKQVFQSDDGAIYETAEACARHERAMELRDYIREHPLPAQTATEVVQWAEQHYPALAAFVLGEQGDDVPELLREQAA